MRYDEHNNKIFPSLRLSDFSWRVEGEWEQNHKQYWAYNRYLAFSSLTSVFSQPSKQFSVDSKIDARWVLDHTSSKSPLAWAECQGFCTSTSSQYLFIGFSDATYSFTQEEITPVISTLISAVLLGSDPDILYLSGGKKGDQILLNEMELGSSQKISFPLDRTFPLLSTINDSRTLQSSQRIEIPPNQWWASEAGKKEKKTLNYIALRKTRLEESCCCQGNKKSKSFMANLFKGRA